MASSVNSVPSQVGEPHPGTVTRRLPRKYGLAGIGLFFVGFALGAVSNTIRQFWIVPFADIVIVFAVFVAIFGGVRAEDRSIQS